MVAAPLQLESGAHAPGARALFGLLVVARARAGGFTSSDCEFLRQLSEHVAFAAHQAQLRGALQAAYDDLRRTQQAVMQQERLRALGEMASGAAHNINNAISPVMLYTESLLESEPGSSARARDYLETIQASHRRCRADGHEDARIPPAAGGSAGLAPVSLNELARQAADLTKVRWSDCRSNGDLWCGCGWSWRTICRRSRRRQGDSRGADQPDFQRRGCHAHRRNADVADTALPAHGGRGDEFRDPSRSSIPGSGWMRTPGGAVSSLSSRPRASAARGSALPWSTVSSSTAAPASTSRARQDWARP